MKQTNENKKGIFDDIINKLPYYAEAAETYKRLEKNEEIPCKVKEYIREMSFVGDSGNSEDGNLLAYVDIVPHSESIKARMVYKAEGYLGSGWVDVVGRTYLLFDKEGNLQKKERFSRDEDPHHFRGGF